MEPKQMIIVNSDKKLIIKINGKTILDRNWTPCKDHK